MTTTPHPTGTILTTTNPHPTKPQTYFYQITHTGTHHYLLQPLTTTTNGTHATPGPPDKNRPLELHPTTDPLTPWDGTPQPHYEP